MKKVTVLGTGDSSQGQWIRLQTVQQTTFGETRLTAFVGVKDHTAFTDGQVIDLPTKEYNMLRWTI